MDTHAKDERDERKKRSKERKHKEKHKEKRTRDSSSDSSSHSHSKSRRSKKRREKKRIERRSRSPRRSHKNESKSSDNEPLEKEPKESEVKIEAKPTEMNETEETEPKKRKSAWDEPPKSLLSLPVQVQLSSLLPQPVNISTNRIYVGNICFEIGEQEIKQEFSRFGTIRGFVMPREAAVGRHKGYCFIDYAQKESADLAITSMQGAIFANRQLKIGRPTESAMNTSTISPAVLAGHVILPVEPVNPLKVVYLGSVPWDTPTIVLRELFSPFGLIKDCQMAPNPENGKHKGYGFIEFEDPQSASQAINQMNGMILGGRVVKVAPATPSLRAEIIAANKSLGVLASQMQTQTEQTLSKSSNNIPNLQLSDTISLEENITIREASQRAQVMKSLLDNSHLLSSSIILSRVILLDEMASPEDVDDRLEEEIREECVKFGPVSNVLIKVFGLRVRIFVEFVTPDSSQKAVAKLDKRWFNKRQVKASYYDEKAFANGNYYL